MLNVNKQGGTWSAGNFDKKPKMLNQSQNKIPFYYFHTIV